MLRFALAGAAAIAVGVGLARFAFIVFMPALVAAGWFAPAEAAWLGPGNLLGYLLGALTAHHLAQRFEPGRLVRAAMLAATVSFIASAADGGFAWCFGWRVVSGAAGAVLMVLASPLVLAHAPEGRRGRLNGVVFAGVGLGAAVAGLATPWLAGFGAAAMWLGVGGVMALLTLLTWGTWGDGVRLGAAPAAAPAPLSPAAGRNLTLLLLAYGLDAVGYVPHIVFWVDFQVRALGHSLAAGGANWVIFGAGALAGPLLAGALADRIGFRRALALALAVKGLAVSLPLWTTAAPALALSALTVGALTPGVVALTSGAALEVVGPAHHRRVWGRLTLIFALSQAAAGFAMAGVFAHSGSYELLFAIAAAALAGAAVPPLLTLLHRPRFYPQSRRQPAE